MRIPERDVTYTVLFVYLLTLTTFIRHKMDHTKVNFLQLKTSELELDFAQYIQYTYVRIADLCGPTYITATGYIISATVDFVYINMQP